MAETPIPPRTEFFPRAAETQQRSGTSIRIYAADSAGNQLIADMTDTNNPVFQLFCAEKNNSHSISAATINREFMRTLEREGENAIFRRPNVAQAITEAVHFISNSGGTRITPTPAHRPDYQPYRLCARIEANGGILTRPPYPQR